MRHEGMTQQEFATTLELSPSSLSSIFNGRTNPTNNHVLAIHKRFPNINVNWLMFGEGDMYVDDDSTGELGGTEMGSVNADGASASESTCGCFAIYVRTWLYGDPYRIIWGYKCCPKHQYGGPRNSKIY